MNSLRPKPTSAAGPQPTSAARPKPTSAARPQSASFALVLACASAGVLASPVARALPSWDSAGALTAQQIVDLPAEDRPLSSDSFEEAYRVDPSVLLSRIVRGEFDHNGVLYLEDVAEAVRLLAVEDNGGSVREIGGQGEGPGEFTMLTHFAVLVDGRVAAFDGQHNAYQLFGADGRFERMVKLGNESGFMAAMANIGRSARRDRTAPTLISLNEMSFDASSVESGEATAEPRGRTIERIGLEGDEAEIDTVLVAWARPPGKDAETDVGGITLNIGGGLQAFEPEVHYATLPEGMIALSDSSAYAIKVTDGDGQVLRVLRRPFSPRPVTSEMRNSAREAFRREIAGVEENEQMAELRGRVGQFMEEQLAQMRFYHEVPVVAEIRAGWERAIWVMRSGDEPWEDDAHGPIDVLTTAGEYLGTFAQDAIDMPLALGPDGLAAFVEVDAFDVPTVVVKRLPERLR